MAIVDDFPSLSTPASGDEIPIERGTTTYKIDYDALAEAIIAKLGGDPVTVVHGGTGISTEPSLLIDLASTQAASPFAATPRPGVTNTLPITAGGTNATTAADARSNLSAAATFYPTATNWSGLHSVLTDIPTNYTGMFKCNATTSGTLTGGKVGSILYGMVSRLTSTIFEFFAGPGNSSMMYKWRVTFASDGASATVGTVYRITGIEMT